MERLWARVENEVGLHARPAAAFVEAACRFKSSIRVRNASTKSPWADAKGILGVLTLGVEKGHSVELEIEGADELAAVEALETLIVSNFG
jgi:phosphotransferase system HPr (HPr) family protein